MRHSFPVALVLVVALLAAGCGSKKSSETTSTADWANSVCSAITTWTSSIKAVGDLFFDSKGGNLSKESLQSHVDDVEAATETLRSDLRGLGKPNTQSGQQAKDLVDQLASDLKTEIDSIKQTVDGASGYTGAVTAAAAVSTTLVTMGDQISSTFKSLQELDAKGELQTAFQHASSCKKLSS